MRGGVSKGDAHEQGDRRRFCGKADEVTLLQRAHCAQKQRLVFDEVVREQQQRHAARQRRAGEHGCDRPGVPQRHREVSYEEHAGVRHRGEGERAAEDLGCALQAALREGEAKEAAQHEQGAERQLGDEAERAERDDGGVRVQKHEQRALGATKVPQQQRDGQGEQREAERVHARLEGGERLGAAQQGAVGGARGGGDGVARPSAEAARIRARPGVRARRAFKCEAPCSHGEKAAGCDASQEQVRYDQGSVHASSLARGFLLGFIILQNRARWNTS